MKDNLSEQIFLALRDRILDGIMTANNFYTERGVAEEFSISKATARDVLHRLCFSGYMTRHPRKGYIVNMVLGDEFRQIQQIRYAVEGLAIKLVIKNCSSDEIRTLYQYSAVPSLSGNPTNETNEMQNLKFHSEIGTLSKSAAAYHIIFDKACIATRAADNFKYLQNTPEEHSHNALVATMLNRDVTLALFILRKHLALDDDGL